MIQESLEEHIYATKAPTLISWYHEQAEMTQEIWTPFNFLISAWKGSGQGPPGHSHVERNYEFVLNQKFLFVQHKSVYESQEKNPHGEIHADWGSISYDRAREAYDLRQSTLKVL